MEFRTFFIRALSATVPEPSCQRKVPKNMLYADAER